MKAVYLAPTEGYGYSDATRNAFYDELDKIANLLFTKKAYLTQEEINQAEESLRTHMTELNEVKLDKAQNVNIKVTYIYPTKGSVSNLIKDYFRDDQDNIIEKQMEATVGQEIRIPIDSTIVQQFHGYKPSSFHYNADDGTLQLVRILKDTWGNEIAVFKANVSTPKLGASLVISYEEGQPNQQVEKPKMLTQESKFTKGSKQPLVIITNGDFILFKGIQVDGKNLYSPTDYEVAEGSTILTFQPEYLESLPTGAHIITFLYEYGNIDGTFMIDSVPDKNTDMDVSSPIQIEDIANQKNSIQIEKSSIFQPQITMTYEKPYAAPYALESKKSPDTSDTTKVLSWIHLSTLSLVSMLFVLYKKYTKQKSL